MNNEKDCTTEIIEAHDPQEELEAVRKLMGDRTGEVEFVTHEDNFEFECQQCGACCMHRNDIILSPFDIYHGAKYLGITPDEFLKKYTEHCLGGNSKLPIVLLSSDQKTGFCPFLEFDYKNSGKFKCAIHAAKPGACRNHPIGIMSHVEQDQDGAQAILHSRYVRVASCPQSHTGVMQNVGEWVKPYEEYKEEHDVAREMAMFFNTIVNWRELFLMTGAFACSLVKTGKPMKNDAIVASFDMIATQCMYYGYAKYDTDRPFVEQCRENMRELREKVMPFAEKTYELLRELFDEAFECTLESCMEKAAEIGLEAVVAGFRDCDPVYEGINLDELLNEKNNEEGNDVSSES